MTMLTILFFLSAAMAIGTTAMVLLSRNPVYAALYLVLSLFSVATVMYTLGAAFLAMLEIIVYAGAIMVLFLFVVMMLHVENDVEGQGLALPRGRALLVPGVLAALLLLQITWLTISGAQPGAVGSQLAPITVKALGQQLYNQHFLGVKLASLLLLIGTIGGMHLGRATHENEGLEAVKANAAR